MLGRYIKCLNIEINLIIGVFDGVSKKETG